MEAGHVGALYAVPGENGKGVLDWSDARHVSGQ